MFLKTSIFRKLCKEAWRGGGLFLHCENGVYIIYGRYWQVEVGVEELTNAEKAAIIELAGEMPQEGEHFKAFKSDKHSYIQQIFRDEGRFPHEPISESFRSEGVFTPITINGSLEMAVIRDKKSQDCYCVPRIVKQMITNEQDDTDPDPWGPVRGSNLIAWTNNITTVITTVHDYQDEEWQQGFLYFLKEVDLGERYADEV